ncbi:MAG: Glutamyl-tRNA(Gln) amidotransferase subunit D [Euryarchaeota archaeon ADurb.Bin190]|nr:MAG: Glutamyl-tRNA(Gln) amidotransferase subunit D [Euryarchaeota archaeon ADurb.Bin190]
MIMDLGDRISVERGGTTYEGSVMPSRREGYVVIKLDNGYNIGFDAAKSRISLLQKRQESRKIKSETALPRREGLPQVSILSTGGTIASKVDYRTGAVTSQFSAGEIISAIPELEEIANYSARVVYQILSENMRAEYWIELANKVAREIESGAEGVIITHGTDTMMYTAAALSFMLRTPVPVVLVGSQRSSDRPSSDASMNAVCAASVAISDIAEVTVVMHGSTSDDFCSIHRGTRVRKMHTSRRDAFQSINQPPLGKVDYLSRKVEAFQPYRRRGEAALELQAQMEERCALVKYTPGSSPDILNYYIDKGYKGIVLEGTGLGHVASNWIEGIKRATEEGVPVVVASQCLRGRICDRVYDTGRDMLQAGAIEGADMLPEVALVKMMWLLANHPGSFASLIRQPLAGEIAFSTPITV